jgi:hypothetical protein
MLYHYTTSLSYKQIINDGMIRPSTAFIPAHEKPITWFSADALWEPTVQMLLFRKMDRAARRHKLCSLLQMDILPMRFVVDDRVAPHHWKGLKKLSGMSKKIARGLEQSGLSVDACPENWRGTFAPVGCEEWVSVEYFKGADWTPIEPIS